MHERHADVNPSYGSCKHAWCLDNAVTATRLDGATIEARGRVQDGAFVWGFQDPRAGHLRYTIRLSPDQRWTEVGERSSDGVAWTKYFEMTLGKV